MFNLLAISFPQWLIDWDLGVDNWIQSWRTPFLDSVFTFITRLGDEGLVWIAVALVFLCFKKTRKIGITMALGLIITTILGNEILKKIVQRPRPFDTPGALLDGDSLLVPRPGQYSFPSGHTGSSFASAVSIVLYDRKWGIPALILAALIAFSRLYVYVHFPTDILAGTVLGTASALIAFFLWRTWLEKLVVKTWNKIFKKHTIERI
ncbi:MAG: phosphatase PAP2 family protein [Clostridia bacterium]|nr:phosphatase PAP2 family protein [Clostridia bacterium]